MEPRVGITQPEQLRPSRRPGSEWLGWANKRNAWVKYQGSIPAGDYALLTDDGKFAQTGELGRGKALMTNGLD